MLKVYSEVPINLPPDDFILRLFANKRFQPYQRDELASMVHETRRLYLNETIEMIRHHLISPDFLDRSNWGKEKAFIQNPHQCLNNQAIKAKLEEMCDAGVLELLAPEKGRELRYTLTLKGAKALGDETLIKAFEDDISTAEFQKQHTYVPPEIDRGTRAMQSALGSHTERANAERNHGKPREGR